MVEKEEYPYVTPETIVQRRNLLWVFWDEPFESALKRLAPRQYEELSESEKVRLMGKVLWDLFQRYDIPAEVRDRIDFLAHADPKLSLRENLETIAESTKDPIIRETIKKIIADVEGFTSKRAEREAEMGWEIIYEAEQPKPGEVIVEYLLQNPEEFDRLKKLIKENPEEAIHELWELVKPEIGVSEATEEDILKLIAHKELEAILEAVETAHLEQKHIENLKERLNRCVQQLKERIEKMKREEAVRPKEEMKPKKEKKKPAQAKLEVSKVFRVPKETKPLTLSEIARRERKDIYDVFTEVVTRYTRDPKEIRCVFFVLVEKGLDKATIEDIKKAIAICRE